MDTLTDIKNVGIHIGCGICCVLLALVIVVCCSGGFLWWCSLPKETTIERVKLDNNQTIRIWYETDVQHAHPSIYYQVTQGYRVIVPKTWVATDSTCDHLCQYEIELAYAQNKTLICLYDAGYQENGIMIFYNTQTGEAWPDNGRTMMHTIPDENWRSYYTQLKDENPSLPRVEYFER